jgi:hypothetical protein
MVIRETKIPISNLSLHVLFDAKNNIIAIILFLPLHSHWLPLDSFRGKSIQAHSTFCRVSQLLSDRHLRRSNLLSGWDQGLELVGFEIKKCTLDLDLSWFKAPFLRTEETFVVRNYDWNDWYSRLNCEVKSPFLKRQQYRRVGIGTGSFWEYPHALLSY